jgi:hypothetical protein
MALEQGWPCLSARQHIPSGPNVRTSNSMVHLQNCGVLLVLQMGRASTRLLSDHTTALQPRAPPRPAQLSDSERWQASAAVRRPQGEFRMPVRNRLATSQHGRAGTQLQCKSAERPLASQDFRRSDQWSGCRTHQMFASRVNHRRGRSLEIQGARKEKARRCAWRTGCQHLND